MGNSRMTSTFVIGAAGTATALVIAAAMIIFVSGQTMATPTIAQQTKQPCTTCHTAPPTLNDYGKKYKEGLKK